MEGAMDEIVEELRQASMDNQDKHETSPFKRRQCRKDPWGRGEY
jgi:hypothetical protein